MYEWTRATGWQLIHGTGAAQSASGPARPTGERAFPFQVTVYLSDRSEFEGGETVLTFQRPRAQSVARALSFERGDALIVTNRYRPVAGARGSYRENVRHGISLVTRGERYALGVIFHDSK